MEIISPKEEKCICQFAELRGEPKPASVLSSLTFDDYQRASCQEYPGCCQHCWPEDYVWSGGEQLCGPMTQLLHSCATGEVQALTSYTPFRGAEITCLHACLSYQLLNSLGVGT